MGEKIETFEEIWQRLDDEQTTEQIVEGLNTSATGNHLSEESKAAAAAVHAELLKRLETADPEARLAVARAARSHFRQICDENTKRYCVDQIENHWEKWRALRHYQYSPEQRPVTSKYSLEEIANYRDAVPIQKPSLTPSASEEDI